MLGAKNLYVQYKLPIDGDFALAQIGSCCLGKPKAWKRHDECKRSQQARCLHQGLRGCLAGAMARRWRRI